MLLRIFLIDGDQETENIVRKMGRAAGYKTKVVPIKNYEFENGMIRDIREAMTEMYDIGEF